MNAEIISRPDVELLVNKFYEKVQADPVLAPHFKHLNWEKHLPIMYSFWSSLLLGDQTYRGNPFQPHLALKIDASHFQQWLHLFISTVQENFTGEKAEEAISRAQSIAGVWQHKMGVASKA